MRTLPTIVAPLGDALFVAFLGNAAFRIAFLGAALVTGFLAALTAFLGVAAAFRTAFLGAALATGFLALLTAFLGVAAAFLTAFLGAAFWIIFFDAFLVAIPSMYVAHIRHNYFILRHTREWECPVIS